MALRIECPFCGKLEEREFLRSERDVLHSIPCDECKLIDRGRMTLVDMHTAISVILGTDRPKTREKTEVAYTLHRLRVSIQQAIIELDKFVDEVPF